MNSLFIDTSYVVAAVVKRDQYHEKARALYQHISHESIPLLTTKAVLLEIGNQLSKSPYRAAFLDVMRDLQRDAFVTIVPVSEELFERGLELFSQRPDKEWGLVDCTSFVVMRNRGMTDALTTDEHFEQAGFTTLLRG